MSEYCPSIYKTLRFKSREVMVGDVGVGGENPIRIQSMTTSSTRDVEGTVEQVIRLKDAGCEIVRVTVQGMKEALACEEIKNRLEQKGVKIPLVADIHFYPPAAMQVIEFVDKVRINPGNFVDKRASFQILEYDEASYQKELERIEEKFMPLVEKCKVLKRAMRIGTNHGSLSDRIMNVYGDSPSGMVESALEFARVCRKADYHDFIFSMKASNPIVMIEAYRLLVAKMMELGWDYPLHLGVTEAGQGEDGRIKSAIGIGSLLLDGLGDTIRISLTEDPWYEVDPCKRLIDYVESSRGLGIGPFEERGREFNDLAKREVQFSKRVAFHRDGTVMLKLDEEQLLDDDLYQNLGLELQLGRPKLTKTAVDMILLDKAPKSKEAKRRLEKLQVAGVGVLSKEPIQGAAHIFELEKCQPPMADRFSISFGKSAPYFVEVGENPKTWEKLTRTKPVGILFNPKSDLLHNARRFFTWLKDNEIELPVVLALSTSCSFEQLIIEASAEVGALLTDKLGEGVCLTGPYPLNPLRQLSFNLLQGCRMRTTKTEFISCPSCGRTLFDLQEVTKQIQERTAHLPGVKIAIMGCIVNGPGEMADADFGYVGSRPGMIDLYVGKTCVEKNISFSEGPDRLIELIKEEGRWVEPKSENQKVTKS